MNWIGNNKKKNEMQVVIEKNKKKAKLFWVTFGVVLSVFAVVPFGLEIYTKLSDPNYQIKMPITANWQTLLFHFGWIILLSRVISGVFPYIFKRYKEDLERVVNNSITKQWRNYAGSLELVHYVKSRPPLDTDAIRKIIALFLPKTPEGSPKNNIFALDWSDPVQWIINANKMQLYLAIQNRWKMQISKGRREITRFFLFEEFSEKYHDVILPNLINGANVYLISMECLRNEIKICDNDFSKIDEVILKNHMVNDATIMGRDIAIMDININTGEAAVVDSTELELALYGYLEPDSPLGRTDTKIVFIEDQEIIKPYIKLILMMIKKFKVGSCTCPGCIANTHKNIFSSREPNGTNAKSIQGCFCVTYFNNEEFHKDISRFERRYDRYANEMSNHFT